MICVIIGILGDHHKWFGKISGVLITIALAACATSTGLIPSAADPAIEVPVYHFVFTYLVPISIPLLLFNAHLKKIIRESGRLLLIFLIGSLGVVLGAIFAFYLLSLGPETYKVAAIFIGTYTGGSVNFMAVASSFQFLDSELFPTMITVDNVFTNLYFMLLFLLPAMKFMVKRFAKYKGVMVDPGTSKKTINNTSYLDIEKVSVALGISVLIFGAAQLISEPLQALLNTEMSLDILLVTLFITGIANLAPDWISKYSDAAFALGMTMMYIFLAVIGASCNLIVLVNTSGSILLFVIIILSVHLLVTLVGGKLLGVSLEETLIASAANAGGPSISAPMAVNFGKPDLVTPAILIGIMGYLIGTFLGVGTGFYCNKPSWAQFFEKPEKNGPHPTKITMYQLLTSKRTIWI